MRRELVGMAVKLSNSQLRHHNTLLRKNLKTLIRCSTDNEHAQERIDRIDRSLFEAVTIKGLFDTLLTEGARVFEMDYITVALEPSIRDFYPDEYHKKSGSHFLHADRIIFAPSDVMEVGFPGRPEPVMKGGLTCGTSLYFPNGLADKIRSEALTPLDNRSRLIGVVAFGSHNPERFSEGYSGRYLHRLARTITLKVELIRATLTHDKKAVDTTS